MVSARMTDHVGCRPVVNGSRVEHHTEMPWPRKVKARCFPLPETRRGYDKRLYSLGLDQEREPPVCIGSGRYAGWLQPDESTNHRGRWPVRQVHHARRLTPSRVVDNARNVKSPLVGAQAACRNGGIRFSASDCRAGSQERNDPQAEPAAEHDRAADVPTHGRQTIRATSPRATRGARRSARTAPQATPPLAASPARLFDRTAPSSPDSRAPPSPGRRPSRRRCRASRR